MQSQIEKNIVCDIHNPKKYFSSNSSSSNNNNNNNDQNSQPLNKTTPMEFIRNPILKINTPGAKATLTQSSTYNTYQPQQKQKTVNIITPSSSTASSVLSESFRSNSNVSTRNGFEKNLSFVLILTCWGLN